MTEIFAVLLNATEEVNLSWKKDLELPVKFWAEAKLKNWSLFIIWKSLPSLCHCNCFEVLAKFEEQIPQILSSSCCHDSLSHKLQISWDAATPMTEAYLFLLYNLLSNSHKMLDITVLQLQIIKLATSTEQVPKALKWGAVDTWKDTCIYLRRY